jgi:hypothetical protein
MQRSLARRYAGDQSSESLQRPTSNTCGGENGYEAGERGRGCMGRSGVGGRHNTSAFHRGERHRNGEGVAWEGVAWVGCTCNDAWPSLWRRIGHLEKRLADIIYFALIIIEYDM